MRRESSPEPGEAWEKFRLPRSAGGLELNWRQEEEVKNPYN